MELQRLLAAAHTCVELAQGRVRFQHSGEDTRGFAVHLPRDGRASQCAARAGKAYPPLTSARPRR
eukprot:scaffold262511_cov28-Tisochrysis_lutea.AAC.2